jgi:hypothetical protein
MEDHSLSDIENENDRSIHSIPSSTSHWKERSRSSTHWRLNENFSIWSNMRQHVLISFEISNSGIGKDRFSIRSLIIWGQWWTKSARRVVIFTQSERKRERSRRIQTKYVSDVSISDISSTNMVICDMSIQSEMYASEMPNLAFVLNPCTTKRGQKRPLLINLTIQWNFLFVSYFLQTGCGVRVRMWIMM